MSLLPPYPPPGVPPVPMYDSIEDIIMDLWDHCMELEDEYHRTGDHEVLIKFATTIVIVQYWEDMLLTMEGFHVFSLRF
jgi:hypothetical protein